MTSVSETKRQALQRRVDAALGHRECDLRIDNVRWLDAFCACFRDGRVAIDNGVVVGTTGNRPAKQIVDGGGKYLVPGFIDAHVHVESSMMLPESFATAVLSCGTTTAICDPHEIANVVGAAGIRYFLDAATRVPLDLWVMLSSCVPATHLETNGGGTLDVSLLAELKQHPRALGLAEVMNYPGVLFGDSAVLDKLAAFADGPIDGHAPLVRDEKLAAYATTGITSCHESSSRHEAQEKLTQGLAVWIREGSVAKDAQALAPLLSIATSTSMGFCTDDRNPYDIAREGHVDHVLRVALQAGAPPEAVYRAASFAVARHYGLDRGWHRVGAIAPGYAADLVLLDDPSSCAVSRVWKGGVDARELDDMATSGAESLRDTVHAAVPEPQALSGPTGQVRVITVEPGKILTGGCVMSHDAPLVCRLSVLERYGHGYPPANGYVFGFGPLRGAIASSVGHDSHNLIVVGNNTSDMRTALAALLDLGGGFAVASAGVVRAQLALPYGGLMSALSPSQLADSIAKLKEASGAIGCTLPEPFLQLAFLSLPVIPTLKLTDRGLVDVDKFAFISVAA